MWSAIELREIRVFLALADELHFARAAERLRLTPSRVSQMLRELEAKVGGELLSRTSRRAELTELGNRFLFEVRAPLPGSAWFSVDRRFNPEEELDRELERLTAVINDAAERVGAKAEIEVLQAQPSVSTDEDHPTAQALARCIEVVEGAAARFQLCPGVLDTRWYAQLGIPAFGYGGGRLDVSHGPDEYISETAMRRCAAVYALLPAQLAR